jgi:hypothetical protein
MIELNAIRTVMQMGGRYYPGGFQFDSFLDETNDGWRIRCVKPGRRRFGFAFVSGQAAMMNEDILVRAIWAAMDRAWIEACTERGQGCTLGWKKFFSPHRKGAA